MSDSGSVPTGTFVQWGGENVEGFFLTIKASISYELSSIMGMFMKRVCVISLI